MSFKFAKPKSSQDSYIALQLQNCFAKTYINLNGKETLGRDIFTHCLIVGCVARSILSRIPPWLKHALFPPGSELIAASHDVGKISPSFQEKIRRGRIGTSNYVRNSEKGLENVNPDESAWGGHAGVSQLAAEAYIEDKYIPRILGQHHGYSPSLSMYPSVQATCFGGIPWQKRREELFQALKDDLGCEWPTVESPLQARVLAGLTTVSDWIGSGSSFDDPKEVNWPEFIEGGIDLAGLICPKTIPNLSFEKIFEYLPRPAQQQFAEVCRGPGVYVLEAPMGIGKTEAALYAAYQLLDSGHATGIYFALPTQLTSEKIHERVDRFLEKILLPSHETISARLIHGNAWLKLEMGEEGQPGGSWFTSTKRAILAPFGVGTIDQALMAVMNVKHGFVRTFGLAGKVVILDEVHSYDSYTGTILDELAQALRNLKCTVIILSATLTLERRAKLLNHRQTKMSYPLISFATDGEYNENAIEPDSDLTTAVQFCHDELLAIEEVLRRAEEGEHVLWIENTVAEAQELFALVAARAAEMNIEFGLLHSRLLKCDRQRIEDKWVAHFGKEGLGNRRGKGRILVGTQVLEQSLDIDADFLVTRICPTDMILQRMGRLWRHSQTPRPSSAGREAWILSPSLDAALQGPEEAIGKSAKVYSPYVLLRSIEVWEKIDSVSLPSDLRDLIEKTYEHRKELGEWSKWQRELESHIKTLKRFAQIGLSTGGQTLPECKASTRYGEIDTAEVLLIQDLISNQEGARVRLLGGKEITLPKLTSRPRLSLRRQLSIALMQNVVRVPEFSAPAALSQNQLAWLEGYLYVGEGEDMLRIARVSRCGRLVTLDGASDASPSKRLSYSSTLGYRIDNHE